MRTVIERDKPMTLLEIASLPKETLTCKDIAPILGYGEYQIHQQAIEHPELLGFPVIVIRKRVKIPKGAFIAFMNGTLKH